MSETLKPCPFCGNAAHVTEKGGMFRVECTERFAKCGMNMRTRHQDTPEAAEILWNTRADDNRWRSVAEQAEKALKGLTERERELWSSDSAKGIGLSDAVSDAYRALSAFDSLRKEQGL